MSFTGKSDLPVWMSSSRFRGRLRTELRSSQLLRTPPAGFVMSCKGFLAETPSPTAAEIAAGLSGNLCRCGSYVGILTAVAEAARAPG